MRSIIPDNRNPFASFHKLTFELYDKTDNSAKLGLKLNTHGIIIVQESAKFNSAHETILQQKKRRPLLPESPPFIKHQRLSLFIPG